MPGYTFFQEEIMEINEFIARRDEALLSLDRERIIALFNETETEIPEDETTFWAGVHMARMEVKSFSAEVKAESLGWLHANGFAV